MVSVEMEFDHITEYLMQQGVDVSLKNDLNRTALDIAIILDAPIGMVLINKDLLTYQGKNGDTLLIKACKKIDYFEDDILFLIEGGADMYIENKKGESAYSTLIARDDLKPRLQSLKEKLILDQMVDQHNDNGPSL